MRIIVGPHHYEKLLNPNELEMRHYSNSGKIVLCVKMNFNNEIFEDLKEGGERGTILMFSDICKIIHLNAIKYKGEIMSYDIQYFYIGWDFQENQVGEEFMVLLCALNIFTELHREKAFHFLRKKNGGDGQTL